MIDAGRELFTRLGGPMGNAEECSDMLLPLSLALAAMPARVIAFPIGRTRCEPSAHRVTDTELIAAALMGKRAAQHALYTRHVARITHRVARLLGRSTEAEDVVQDAFVVAFRDLAQLSDPERFGGWLSIIAVHQVHRRLRRRALLRRLGFEASVNDVTLSNAADPTAGPMVQTMLRQLDQALAHLPVAHRLAWMLRHVEGCTLDEVAAQCGVSLATVKRYLGRAESELMRYINFEATVEGSGPDSDDTLIERRRIDE